MAVEFKLPALGENIESGDVTRVLVKIGDTIRAEQPVLEMETGKATVEVPSDVAGVVREIHVKEGAKARVGQLINVLVQQGGVQLKWVAEARESGAYGQTIRVRKPGTRDEFSILLTGAQQGKLISSPSNVAVVP